MEDRTPPGGRPKPSPETSRRSSLQATVGTGTGTAIGSDSGSNTPAQSATGAESARRRPQPAMQPSGYGKKRFLALSLQPPQNKLT